MMLNPNCSEWVTFLYIMYDDLTKKEREEMNKYLSMFDEIDCCKDYAVARVEDMTDEIEECIMNTPFAKKLKIRNEQEYV